MTINLLAQIKFNLKIASSGLKKLLILKIKYLEISCLFFAMIHFNPFWTVQIYLLGVILGFLSWRTNSIIPSIVLHSMNNGIAFILTVFDESDLGIYLWNENVSPLFIAIAIYLIYSGFKNITQNEK